MTWEEWINSEYNYNNYTISESCIKHHNSTDSGFLYVNGSHIMVNKTDYIDANNTYIFMYGGSGD